MATTNSPGSRSRTPARLLPQDLAEQLWQAWPFAGPPWREMLGPVPFRVEELREGDELVVRAELPGVDPEKDITVTVEDDTLTISAQREERQEAKSAEGFRSEFRYGRLERRLPLPRGTAGDAVRAGYRDGVLEVRLPAPPPEGEPRRISVERT